MIDYCVVDQRPGISTKLEAIWGGPLKPHLGVAGVVTRDIAQKEILACSRASPLPANYQGVHMPWEYYFEKAEEEVSEFHLVPTYPYCQAYASPELILQYATLSRALELRMYHNKVGDPCRPSRGQCVIFERQALLPPQPPE
eukprot:8946489-Pyramimonas_sp.AAC.1